MFWGLRRRPPGRGRLQAQPRPGAAHSIECLHPSRHTKPPTAAGEVRRGSYPLVVAISGRTRAGKTTLANALQETLHWPVGSFSFFVRAEARDRGVAETREYLQDLGALLIEELGPLRFCEAALAANDLLPLSGPRVIEGVRHLITLQGLRRAAAPAPVRLVHLDVSDSERDRRLRLEGVAVEEGAAWEQHSTERDVLDGLGAAADLVVDANQPAKDVAKSVISWLEGDAPDAFRPAKG